MMLRCTTALLGLLSAATAKSIPKTIIQTSKDAIIDRPDWIEYRNSLKAANPDFELVHYSDDEARAFIKEHYGDTILEQAYDMVTPIMRADLFRLAAIYKLGGFYMDMDMLGKESLNPIVDAINNDEYQAVFPKEWWTNTGFYVNIFPGRVPEDPEDHWQVGQYAFAAVPEHPFIKDALEEATIRSVNLMKMKGDNVEDIRDVDILATTGPYLFTELYHDGRKAGKYADVLHLQGDSEKPVLEHTHGGPDWHKFGKYCEHMLSHTWVKADRKLETYALETYAEYGVVKEDVEVMTPTLTEETMNEDGDAPVGMDSSGNSAVLTITVGIAVAMLNLFVFM